MDHEYFRHKNITLYHGDVLNQDLFNKQFIDLIVTSPPYNDDLSYQQYLEFFPKELPYRAIKLFSYQDDIVFDPFSGSGTTLIVAANTKRIAVGLDIDRNYCELAKNRIINDA